MGLSSADRGLNIKRSLNKYLYENLSLTHFIMYGVSTGFDALERRIADEVEGYWKWIDLFWINMGSGDFSISRLQINCNSLIENDKLKDGLMRMVDDVQDCLNVASIPLFDFSDDPENPVPLDNVLIPRFSGQRTMQDQAENTVNVESLDYRIYCYRASVLP